MLSLPNTREMLGILVIIVQLHVANAALRKDVPHEVYNFKNDTRSAQVPEKSQITSNHTTPESIYVTESAYVTESTAGACPAPTPTRSVYSTVFPSPGASPIEITAQSQVVTSFIPEMTWCVAPPLAVWPITNGPPYRNSSATEHTTSYQGTGSCQTSFAPVQTTVCATTLTGLGSKISVTDCEQQITFSTECGFTLEIPTPTPASTPTITGCPSLITPAPSVRRLYTYWLAPWQSLTEGNTPSDVDVKICTEQDNGTMECLRYQEVWEVVVVTSTRTTERTIQVSTTVSGPGTLVVETMTSTITDTIESIDLSTVLLLETEVETESISSGRKPTTTVHTTQEKTKTVYVTKKLKHASSRYVESMEFFFQRAQLTCTSVPTSTQQASPTTISSSPSDEATTTIWVTSTSTLRITGTITMKRPRPTRQTAEAGPEANQA